MLLLSSSFHSACAVADQQIIIHDLDDLDDEEEDNDDEPMITKVESRQEREQAKADKAQLELSRLQKQQLQAKFDHANHRKAQVRPASTLCRKYVRCFLLILPPLFLPPLAPPPSPPPATPQQLCSCHVGCRSTCNQFMIIARLGFSRLTWCVPCYVQPSHL